MNRPLIINLIGDLNRLVALPYGVVYDGRALSEWEPVADCFRYLRDQGSGLIIGFAVEEFSDFDVEAPEVQEIWGEPRFDVPMLALAGACRAEIILSTRATFVAGETLNRWYFAQAARAQPRNPQQAIALWSAALQCGDPMAHFGLGTAFYTLGRYREAYRHLRYYADISPQQGWNWCWLGQAAEAIGEEREAELAYVRAGELGDERAAARAAELKRALETRRSTGEGRFQRPWAEPPGTVSW